MNKIPFAIIIVTLIIAFIAVFSIGSMVIAANEPEQKTSRTFVSGDVSTLVQVSGNDVIVTIVSGDDADNISSIYAYINGDGFVSRNKMNTCNNVTVGEPVVFKDMVKGASGKNVITIEAVFDGVNKITSVVGLLHYNI